MRYAIGLLLLASVFARARGDDKTEDENLIGTWVITSVEIGGTKFPEAQDSEFFVFAKGGKLISRQKGDPDRIGTFEVVSTKAPRSLNMHDEKFWPYRISGSRNL